ncbi:uncharacterized protein LOC144139611 [Haemaphysalis longicornis]
MQSSNPFLFFIQALLGLLSVSSESPALCAQCQLSTTRFRAATDPEGLSATITFTEHFCMPGGATVSSGGRLSAWAVPPWDNSIKEDLQLPPGSGHGGNAKMQSSNPFLFFIQVRKSYGKCFRSSNRCLVMLPCPRSLYEMFQCVIASLRFLLLLGGDVEENPGPDLETLAKQLSDIAADILEIKNVKAQTNQRLSAIDKKLEKISGFEKQVSDCVKKIASLEDNLQAVTKKLDELENRSRRSNLIIYGVEEKPDESPETLLSVVSKEIFEGILKVNTGDIEKIHRLGKQSTEDVNKIKPIILKFSNNQDKTKIFKNCSKLKGSGYSISDDFSRTMRDVRKKLWDRTKENRDKGEKVVLVYDKVSINGKLYGWDNNRGDLFGLSKNENRPLTEGRVTRSRRH